MADWLGVGRKRCWLLAVAELLAGWLMGRNRCWLVAALLAGWLERKRCWLVVVRAKRRGALLCAEWAVMQQRQLRAVAAELPMGGGDRSCAGQARTSSQTRGCLSGAAAGQLADTVQPCRRFCQARATLRAPASALRTT